MAFMRKAGQQTSKPVYTFASGEVDQRLLAEEIHNFRSVPYLRLVERRFRHG